MEQRVNSEPPAENQKKKKMAEDEGKTTAEGEKIEEMKPWEQHSAVISIPRFDYNASSSLLRHSHSGFLITCPIKREKSATKEAISILEKICVLVEVLPLSGVPDRTAIVGVSVLPRALVTTKPRLSIKALVSDTKETNKKKR
ncbi:hypothetical protein KY290_028064 [Solanum tuberosum]|uniref:Uncharacterized protein n=1 Tax=Solanum tuberosum TaxID=4113 RepID=A0ABQ7UGV7_SOLTU|nr:hypothetical protein KY290_028064 [Solanum tuberosum]